MGDWVTVALSGGSVCVGAGLTLLGQYLADRRSYIRDREARREEFRVTNFEIQRSALLELQEILIDLSKALGGISTRSKFEDILLAMFPDKGKPMQWYQMRDLVSERMNEILEFNNLKEEVEKTDDLPQERTKEIIARAREIAAKLKNTATQIEPAAERIGKVVELYNRIKILAARSGNDEVFDYCRDLMQIVDQWTSAKNAEESNRLICSIKDQTNRTLDIIGDALRHGPFS